MATLAQRKANQLGSTQVEVTLEILGESKKEPTRLHASGGNSTVPEGLELGSD